MIGLMSGVVSDSTPPTARSHPCLLLDSRGDKNNSNYGYTPLRHFSKEEEDKEERRRRKSQRTCGDARIGTRTGAGDMDPAAALLVPSPFFPASHLRQQRSSSDAYVHAVSRSRAAAAAAAARSGSRSSRGTATTNGPDPKGCPPLLLRPLLSPQLLPRSCSNNSSHSLRHQHQHHEHCEVHHSQCSIGGRSGSPGSMCRVNPHLPVTSGNTRRSHSQSSLARLAVKPPPTLDHQHHHPHHHSKSTSNLSRWLLHKRPEEEEVTYVWREGRVQIQQPPSSARNGYGGGSSGGGGGGGGGYTYSERRASPGQHVEYLWQGGNVQKVIRGANNETLATEVVPPRGAVKGLNFCVALFLLLLMVITLIALLFVFKVF